MRARSKAPWLAWLLLLGIGCSGLGGGGGGCGCGACTAIPGGFPAEKRQNNAITAKVTKQGLDTIKAQIAQFISGNGGSNIGYVVPCTDASQKVNVGFGQSVTLNVFLCDMDSDWACTPTDDEPWMRQNDPAHGVQCGAEAAIKSIDITPTQAPDGTVDVAVVLNVRVNTGQILVEAKAPLLCTNLRCAVEYDSDERAPLDLPVNVRMKLKVDPNWNDILALEVVGLDDISGSIDPRELHITPQPGSSCSFGCDVLNVDQVKQLMFARLQGMIARTLKDQVDRLKCLACEPGTNACPAGTTCAPNQGVCYSVYNPSDNAQQDQRACPPAKLGAEGRVDLGPSLASFGGPDSAPLDVSIVAGGRNPDGSAATRVQSGGVVVGVMGGSDAVQRSACVPATPWAPRPAQAALDFDAEAATSPAVSTYALGLALSDNYLDKSLYDVWADGAVCLNVDGKTSTFLSSSLFGTFIRTLPGLTGGEDVPMLIALRPRQAPNVVIGRGTTKAGPNGTQVPDDPLLTLQMDELYIDFYALIEERYTRLFSLTADMKLPLGLEFDPVAGTVTPVLAGLDTLLTNVHASNIELLSDDPKDLEAVIPQIIALIQPQLAGVIAPFAMPPVQGFSVDVVAARGAVKSASGPGYEQLALFTNLAPSAVPMTARADTEARLVEAKVPTAEEAQAGAQPVAIVQAHGTGFAPARAKWEYSFRADGGLWSPWGTNDRLEVSPPILKLQGRHELEVRARFAGSPGSNDLSPAKVPFVVDYDPPTVKLVYDADAREVRTKAHDGVTADDALAFRYRVAGGAWSEAGPARTFTLAELGRDVSLEVEASDEAGHVGRATFGTPANQLGEPSALPVEQGGQAAGGCSAVGGGLFALAGLAAAMRRRRAA